MIHRMRCVFLAALMPLLVDTVEAQSYAAPSGAVQVESEAPAKSPARPPGIGSPSKSKPPEMSKPGEKSDEKKSEEGKPSGDDAKKESGDKPSDDATPVTRPTEPEEEADPKELELRPDEFGRIRFNFNGQPWPGVLQWLAEVSSMSLDWQEVPAGFLNLTTTESYSVDESRDLINRHLLARGYTLLRQGEILSVVKLDKLDPGMIPRVAPKQLDSRDAYEFVKVSFPLASMIASTAVEELKPMLGPHGKLTSLTTTNRLEAIDVVINLREIADLLEQEQSTAIQDPSLQEFPIQHARASEVREYLLALLGVDSKASGPMTPQQMAAAQKAAQMAAQKNGGKPPPAAPKKPSINIVADERRNCIVVHAPPDKMATIAQAILILDVPTDPSNSLLANMTRMQIYRLSGIDPEPLVATLEELGGLDPNTRLHVDAKNRAIIAYASLADHVTIRSVVDKLDGSGRQFEVIQLRRLEADYVAGTIQFMMAGGEEEKKSSSRSYYYSPYSSSSRSSSDESSDKFRVDADVEHNRLLLWASELEIAEVMNLLMKLGEVPAEGGDPRTMRVLDSMPEEEVNALIKSLQLAWPSVAPNPLITPEVETPETEEPVDEQPAAPVESSGVGVAKTGGESTKPVEPRLLHLAQLTEESPSDKPASGLPPVSITRGPDGRLVISSPDTGALDKLEELIAELAPKRVDYKIYKLRFAWAYGLSLTLEDIFGEEEDDSSSRYRSYYYYEPEEKNDSPSRLSDRKPLKFISDSDTNSILVQGATPSQLTMIEELIEYYDTPEATDSQSTRLTEVIKIEYSEATVVAETVKDVFRDLLSSNDKSLKNGQQQQRPERSYTYVYDTSDGNSEEKAPEFKGLLSIGVDQLSNTLVVSTPMYMMDDVKKIITDLDAAAKPKVDVVEVVQLGSGVSASEAHRLLAEILGGNLKSKGPGGNGKPSGKPQQGGPGQPGGAGGQAKPD